MNRYVCAMLGCVLLAGCASPPPPPPRPPSQKESAARARLESLDKQMAARESTQASLSNRVDSIHAALYAAAQEMRDIKLQANDVTMASESNRQAMAALEAEILEQRNVMLECEKEAAEEARKVAALRSAMVREREAAEIERANVLTEEARKSEGVRAALAREKELRERDQAIARENSRQIDSLRSALAERDKMLRSGSVSGPAPVSAPAVQKQPATPAPVRPPPSGAADMTAAFKLVAQGNSLLRENQIDDAEKSYRDALAISPELMDARVGLATCRYTRGDLDEAGRIIGAVLAEDPRNARALGLRGLLLWRRGDLTEATEILQRAVRQDPTDSQLQNYLGIVQFERKRYQAAREALAKAVELDAENGEAHFNLAVVLASGASPDIESSKKHYEEAIRLGSDRDESMDQILNTH